MQIPRERDPRTYALAIAWREGASTEYDAEYLQPVVAGWLIGSSLTTEQLIVPGRADGWLVAPGIHG